MTDVEAQITKLTATVRCPDTSIHCGYSTDAETRGDEAERKDDIKRYLRASIHLEVP